MSMQPSGSRRIPSTQSQRMIRSRSFGAVLFMLGSPRLRVTELPRPSGPTPRGLHRYDLESYSGPEEVCVQAAAVLGVGVPHPTHGDGVVERVDLAAEVAAVVEEGHLAGRAGTG